MSEPQHSFVTSLMEVINRNLGNELFGVSELADAMNMSRSNLLRKVKRETNLSVSQLISQARLTRAMELLKATQLNVTEVSQQVGFSSTSYFIKCFREHYGFPPGEMGKRAAEESDMARRGGGFSLDDSTTTESSLSAAQSAENALDGGSNYASVETVAARRITRWSSWLWVMAGVAVLGAVTLLSWRHYTKRGSAPKAIAVLPFKNESADSSNVYLINGLMDATLNNLQRIGNLNVVSRTTAEKYRNTRKSIREMAAELDVEYFVEGSGQKLGNNILLNIQLIDAATDRHLWARQYRRESSDIFALQQEIASDIAREIEVIVTPEEMSHIEKRPTEDVQAYNYYLEGRESFYRSGTQDLENAVVLFRKAIDRDPKFSLAYAHLVMVCYYLDLFMVNKKYVADIDDYSDKAILYDPKSSESLLAKALAFAQRHRYDLATPYLERALEYSPRSGLVLHFLTDFYSLHVPDPVKYLEYAIRKTEVDLKADSSTRAFNYFHLCYALLQNGFFKDSQKYMEKSLALNPDGFFAKHVKAYISTLESRDWSGARKILREEFKKSPTRFDLLEDIGLMNLMLGDYQSARHCYDSALNIMQMFKMDVLKPEYLHIALAYDITGDTAKARHYLGEFKSYLDQDQTIYQGLSMAMYKAYKGEKKEALELITKWTDEHPYFISFVLIFPHDPLANSLKNEKAFQDAMKKMEANFWRGHRRLDDQWRSRFENL